MKLDIQDKFLQRDGRVFLTGMEAIVRLVREKQERDQASGHVNQTYFTGYEGSPLGGLDLKIVAQLDVLNELGRTVHQFGINEKTAASAVLGSQFAASGDVDAFWYGKAHGTMWIPDEVWLANLSGTGARGAMVLLSGEDHRSKSSVSPGASDWVLRSSMVPIFYPASVEDVIRLGLHAVALSRHAGVVTALKLATPVCDGASTVDLAGVRPDIALPERAFAKRFNQIVMATGALPMQQQLVEEKWPLVEAYVRANDLNRIVNADAGGGVGIVAVGKSYADVRQALSYLGLRVPVLHLAVSYPLDYEIVRAFARGLRRIYVVEEPGPFVEEGVKAALWGADVEAVYGQWDEDGQPLIPAHGEVDPEELALKLGPRLGAAPERLAELQHVLDRTYPAVPRVTPMSCGGCPYNTFRDLHEKPGGAIGCSSIRAIEAYDTGVLYIPTMGAGGSIYSGWAPFNGNQHIYQYLGDGSYFHSGRGAIQSCIQGEVNITFLLLFNGAVALTGGQTPGGQRPVSDVVQELLGLGVVKVGVVSEDPVRYRHLDGERIEVFGLERHAEALAQFKEIAGTTVLILDKECATEKGRRRRRQGLTPDEYVLIDEDICEGCGDCYTQSEGCAALYSVATEFGDKTQVRQAQCAQDGLCIDGECPSFAVVKPAKGTRLRRRRPEPLDELPEPPACPLERPYAIFAMGRGGTGVVTISHLIAYAAMMEGKYVYLSNNTGLAQKGGPVEAPIVISAAEQPVFNRLFPGEVDLYLGFDLLRAAEPDNLKYAAPQHTRALVSTAEIANAAMNRNPRTQPFPDAARLHALIDHCTGKDNIYLDTYWLAERLFSDTIFANMLLLGAAYQAGALPLEAASIERAIALNAQAVENNVQAFRWGRLAVADPARVERALGTQQVSAAQTLAEVRERLAHDAAAGALLDEGLAALADLAAEGQKELGVRLAELCAYQDVAYAQRYLQFVRQVWEVDRGFSRGLQFTRAVVRGLYKLMAYKDEYEVARLATSNGSEERMRALFDGEVEIVRQLHPPTLRRLLKGKIGFGKGLRPALVLLSRLKGLRGTRLDPFGYTEARRLERALVGWYCGLIEEVLLALTEESYGLAVEIAELPDGIRGYEHVKEASAATAKQRAERLLTEFRAQPSA